MIFRPAIERTIEKILQTLKDKGASSVEKSLAVRLSRELIGAASYYYFILLETRVLPLLVYTIERGENASHMPSMRSGKQQHVNHDWLDLRQNIL